MRAPTLLCLAVLFSVRASAAHAAEPTPEAPAELRCRPGIPMLSKWEPTPLSIGGVRNPRKEPQTPPLSAGPACDELDAAVALAPTDVALRYKRGLARMAGRWWDGCEPVGSGKGGLCDDDGANGDFKAVLALDPTRSDAHVQLGVIAMTRERYSLAESHFYNAIAVDPKNAEAYYHRTLVRVMMEDRETEALADADRAVALRPKFYDALVRRGWLRNALSEDKGKTGGDDLTKAIKLQPKRGEAYWERAKYNSGLKPSRLKLVVADCKKMIALDYHAAEAYLVMGKEYHESGRHADAIAALETALTLPGAPRANIEPVLKRAREALAAP